MHGFQIWVNLPAKNKMMAPRYQEISAQDSPTIEKNGVWARYRRRMYGSFIIH